jgi:hypothetical protein
MAFTASRGTITHILEVEKERIVIRKDEKYSTATFTHSQELDKQGD